MISDAAGVARLEGRAAFGIAVPYCAPFVAPLLYAIPIQLLAYHVAVLRHDVDQPRIWRRASRSSSDCRHDPLRRVRATPHPQSPNETIRSY